MPTLSFSCPKCDKLHERIKPEMVGQKVRCQCGYVFRLGSKSDKLEWFSAELKRKKALKKKQEADAQAARESRKRGPAGSFDLQPRADAHDPFPQAASPSNDFRSEFPVVDDRGLGSDGNSVSPPNDHPNGNAGDDIPIQAEFDSFSLDDLSGIPMGTPLDAEILVAAESNHQMPAARPVQLMPDSSLRRANKRTRETSLNSPAGPVCSLVAMLIGIPGVIVVMFLFAAAAIALFRLSNTGVLGAPDGFVQPNGNSGLPSAMAGSVKLQIFFSTGMFMLYGALGSAMLTTAVVAVVELAKGIFIGWASKVSAIIASVVLVCLLLLFCVSVINGFLTFAEFEQSAGITIDKSVLGKNIFRLAVRYCLYGLVPLIVMITGIVRLMKR